MNIRDGFKKCVSWFVPDKAPPKAPEVTPPPMEEKEKPFKFDYDLNLPRTNADKSAIVISDMLQNANERVIIFDRNLHDLLSVSTSAMNKNLLQSMQEFTKAPGHELEIIFEESGKNFNENFKTIQCLNPQTTRVYILESDALEKFREQKAAIPYFATMDDSAYRLEDRVQSGDIYGLVGFNDPEMVESLHKLATKIKDYAVKLQ